LVVVALIVGLAAVAGPIDRAWQAHREHERFVADTDPYMPLGRALTELPPPAGLTAASSNTDTRDAIFLGFRWQGHGITSRRAAEEFERTLRSVGAGHPVARCSTAAPNAACRVDAVLVHRPFTVFIIESPTLPTTATINPKAYYPPAGSWLKARPL
jgi:hypothetical protein